jgi:H+/gluconate symporter-like permease
MFLLGSIFGKLMEDAGAAASVAHWIVRRLGPERAAVAIVAGPAWC